MQSDLMLETESRSVVALKWRMVDYILSLMPGMNMLILTVVMVSVCTYMTKCIKFYLYICIVYSMLITSQ